MKFIKGQRVMTVRGEGTIVRCVGGSDYIINTGEGEIVANIRQIQIVHGRAMITKGEIVGGRSEESGSDAEGPDSVESSETKNEGTKEEGRSETEASAS